MKRTGTGRPTMVSPGGQLASRVKRRSRYSSIGLIAVLLAVSVFAVWSSQATSSAASRVAVTVELSDAYAAAATAVAAEESLERKYRLEPSPNVRVRYEQAAAAFVASLAHVRQDGGAGDRSFVDDMLTQHESYLRAVDRLFRATARGDIAAALKIDNEKTDPAFGAIEAAVLDAAEGKHQESLSQLASLTRLEGVTRTLTPLVFVLGLLLAAALAVIGRGHHRSLQSLSDHHEAILASVGEGVISVDTDGNVTFANPAAGIMLGAEGDSLLGTNICAITCTTPLEGDPQCLLDLVRVTGTVLTRPHAEFVRVDGTCFPAEVTAAPQHDPSGASSASGVVLVFRDTTERLAMSRMKTEFTVAVSHELRTPLTSIRAALELLNDGETGALPPIARRMVATALRGSERLTRLISDIIDVERIEAGSFSIHLADLEVRPVVDAVVSDFQVLAAQAGVNLVVSRATGRARCDSDRLEQALINLIGNAVKFSPPGMTVEISAEPRGQFVQFTVADSGRGIPASQLEPIFERFHQVDASAAREQAGSGLGLPITKSIVEQHGGRIWVESIPGQGSTFRFTIPRTESESDPDLLRWTRGYAA